MRTAKKLIVENMTAKGLNSDKLMRALIKNRSTPNPVTGLSLSNVVFGIEMRGFTPHLDEKYQPKVEYQLEKDMRRKLFQQQNEKIGEAMAMRS